MENKIEKTPANNYDNNIFDKKEKNSRKWLPLMRFLPHIQILFHSFFKLVGTVVEDYSPHGMGGKSNYYQKNFNLRS